MEGAVGFKSPQPPNTKEDIQEENETNTQEAASEETSHSDDETGQPEIEETNTQMTHSQKDEDAEKQLIKHEEVTANLDEKQETKEHERTNEVEQQDEHMKDQIETEANINSESQDIQEEVKEEAKEELQTHDQTLNTENTEHEDTPGIESELPEIAEEPAIEKEGSVSHTENDKETGVADTEIKADDADQSNERPDRDERDDHTDEAGDDGSTGGKIQETDDVMDDAGSVIKQKGEEKSSEEKDAEEDVKDEAEKEEEDKVIVEEVAEKEGEDESKDQGDVGKAIECEEGNKGVEDLKGEDKDEERIERDDRDDREESGEVELQENKEDQDMKAEHTENDSDVEIEKVDVHEGQNESEDGEQGRNEISEDEGPKSENEIIEETENMNSEMTENREQEENENEVEEGNRDEMTEREGEGVTENLTCEEVASKKEEDINEIGENVEEKDENKEVISRENVKGNKDYVSGDQNEKSVIQEEQNEICSSRVPKNTKLKEKVDESLPAGENNDLSGDVDAENGEEENARKDDVEKQEDEEMQDKLEVETTAGPDQDVTDDRETKPEINEGMREDVEVHSEKVVDDKSMTEVADKESETSAKTFIENIVPEELETTNKFPDVEDTTEEHNDMEKAPKDADMRIRDAPEGKDSEPGEPSENSVKEEEDRSMSHSVKSQPMEKVFKNEENNLSIDSVEPSVRPAVLDNAAGVDLVSNWINIHQASRYFQTCIEPVDEIKESSVSDETEKDRNGEVLDATDTQSTNEIATPVQSALNENPGHDTVVESFITEKKPEDLEDNITQEEKVQEGGDKRGSLVTKWSKQSHGDSEIDGREDSSLNNVVKVQDLASELNPNSYEESEQKKRQTTTDEITQLSTVSLTEEIIDKEILDTSEHNVKSEHEYIEPQSPTITVITDLTIVNKSENGSQDDTASVDIRSRQSDGNRRTKVIDGHFKQSVGNDTVSTFSLDDSRFFGPAGYPRLTTAHTENSY